MEAPNLSHYLGEVGCVSIPNPGHVEAAVRPVMHRESFDSNNKKLESFIESQIAANSELPSGLNVLLYFAASINHVHSEFGGTCAR